MSRACVRARAGASGITEFESNVSHRYDSTVLCHLTLLSNVAVVQILSGFSQFVCSLWFARVVCSLWFVRCWLQAGVDKSAVCAEVRRCQVHNFGDKLRAARIRAELSVREFARLAELSPSFVSQIENGKSQPSVTTLYAICQLLGISVDELFEPSTLQPREDSAVVDDEWHGDGRWNPMNAWQPNEYSNRVSVVHPVHRPHLIMSEGIVWERLSATPEIGVNFMKISYAPGTALTVDGALSTHDGYEYGYVSNGVLEVTVGDDVFELSEGQSLGFASTIPHLLRNRGTEPAEGVWFVHGIAH